MTSAWRMTIAHVAIFWAMAGPRTVIYGPAGFNAWNLMSGPSIPFVPNIVPFRWKGLSVRMGWGIWKIGLWKSGLLRRKFGSAAEIYHLSVVCRRGEFDIISVAANEADLCFNTKKTVTMIFNPHNPHKRLHSVFPSFSLSGCQLSFVTHFKYLGHITEHTLHDDSDISRELRCLLFTRTNVLIRRFWRCSLDVKLRLFRTYCMCFYDI